MDAVTIALSGKVATTMMQVQPGPRNFFRNIGWERQTVKEAHQLAPEPFSDGISDRNHASLQLPLEAGP